MQPHAPRHRVRAGRRGVPSSETMQPAASMRPSPTTREQARAGRRRARGAHRARRARPSTPTRVRRAGSCVLPYARRAPSPVRGRGMRRVRGSSARDPGAVLPARFRARRRAFREPSDTRRAHQPGDRIDRERASGARAAVREADTARQEHRARRRDPRGDRMRGQPRSGVPAPQVSARPGARPRLPRRPRLRRRRALALATVRGSHEAASHRPPRGRARGVPCRRTQAARSDEDPTRRAPSEARSLARASRSHSARAPFAAAKRTPGGRSGQSREGRRPRPRR